MRRVRFDEDMAAVPKYFAGSGDPMTSHFWAVLSGSFPEGEAFFVRSVRRFRDCIDDPILMAQVQGFIGQESNHSRQHDALNQHLTSLGYPMVLIERLTKLSNGLAERWASPEGCLAQTVMFEHITALLAEQCLRDETFREEMGDGTFADLLLWHALEESEHKAVAFDVYRAIGGSERARVRAMKVMRWTLPLVALHLVVQVVVTDRFARRPRVLWASIKQFRRSPIFTREIWEALKDFERPDFHPNDRPTDDLAHDWNERLFGVDGTLTDKVA